MVEAENGILQPILDEPLKAVGLKNNADDPNLCDYFVRVERIRTVEEKEAHWGKRLRANQNSALKLKNQFTLDKLIQFLGIDE